MPSQLVLCKVWGFHGGGYEEYRLLRTKPSSYLTGNTLHLRYRAQLVNAMQDLKFLWWWLWRMSSSGMWRGLAVLRTDVSEEYIVSIIRVTRIGELGTVLAATRNRSIHLFRCNGFILVIMTLLITFGSARGLCSFLHLPFIPNRSGPEHHLMMPFSPCHLRHKQIAPPILSKE
jgi:hypothetical protein